MAQSQEHAEVDEQERARRGLRRRGKAAADITPQEFCGVAAAAELLGDVWTLLLVRDLADGPQRFKELEASTGISARVLTDRLRALVDQGVLTRQLYPEIPPRVEYELTEMGRAALGVIDALRAYGNKWLCPLAAPVPGAPPD